MTKPTKYRDVEIRAARGNKLTAKSWLTEAPLRMLMNNLDPEVAENPKALVVYGGIGRAARNWECYDEILAQLKKLEADESLLIQSGKPVGVFKTHPDAPRVLLGLRHEQFQLDPADLPPGGSDWENQNAWDLQGSLQLRPQLNVYAKAARSYRIDDDGYTSAGYRPLAGQERRETELGATFGDSARSASGSVSATAASRE